MSTRNRLLVVLAVSAAAPVAPGCAVADPSADQTAIISADYPAYDSVKSLASAADLIVEVSLGESSSEVLLPQYEGDDPALNPYAGTKETPDPSEGAVPITVFEATVLDVYRGDVKTEDVIKVMQPGGLSNGVDYVVEGVTRLQSGATVLLFLGTYADSPASVLGGDVGAFIVEGEGFVSIASDGLVVSKADLSSY